MKPKQRLTTEQRLNARVAQLADSLRAIVAQGADACTCKARSWYGKGHDSACPITIGRNALKRQGLRHVAPMYQFDDREHATVLAALRYWQREGLMSSGHEGDIATNGGTLSMMQPDEIDALCERLNCGG